MSEPLDGPLLAHSSPSPMAGVDRKQTLQYFH